LKENVPGATNKKVLGESIRRLVSLVGCVFRSRSGGEKQDETESSKFDEIAKLVKGRMENCLSRTHRSRPLHGVSIRSGGGWHRPLTGAPPQANSQWATTAKPAVLADLHAKFTTIWPFTEFVSGAGFEDTSRLIDTDTFILIYGGA
jgi:hypothetical protein